MTLTWLSSFLQTRIVLSASLTFMILKLLELKKYHFGEHSSIWVCLMLSHNYLHKLCIIVRNISEVMISSLHILWGSMLFLFFPMLIMTTSTSWLMGRLTKVLHWSVTLFCNKQVFCRQLHWNNAYNQGPKQTFNLFNLFYQHGFMISYLFHQLKSIYIIYQLFYCCSVAKSCPTLCHPMDCSLPGSSLHGIFPARILEWVAISNSNINYSSLKIESINIYLAN